MLLGLQEPQQPVKVRYAMLQAIWVKLDEYQVSSASESSAWFVTFTILAQAFKTAKLYFTLPKYCKRFDSL